jgi:hypothetical protein
VRRRLALVAAVLALVATACVVSTYEVSYPDLVTARQEDAVKRGWVPEWLPESTTAIHEIHDPGRGERWLTATLVEPDAFRTHCPTVATDVPEVPFGKDAPTGGEVRNCGSNGVGVLVGTTLTIWRGPDDQPSTEPS